MNQANLKLLIERIERCEHVPEEDMFGGVGLQLPSVGGREDCFNMANVRFRCGAPACVSGHCRSLIERKHVADVLADSTGPSMIDLFLECGDSIAYALFNGSFAPKDLQDITPADTVAYLKTLSDEEA